MTSKERLALHLLNDHRYDGDVLSSKREMQQTHGVVFKGCEWRETRWPGRPWKR